MLFLSPADVGRESAAVVGFNPQRPDASVELQTVLGGTYQCRSYPFYVAVRIEATPRRQPQHHGRSRARFITEMLEAIEEASRSS